MYTRDVRQCRAKRIPIPTMMFTNIEKHLIIADMFILFTEDDLHMPVNLTKHNRSIKKCVWGFLLTSTPGEAPCRQEKHLPDRSVDIVGSQ